MKKYAVAIFLSALTLVPAVQPAFAAELKIEANDTLYDAQGKKLGDVFAVSSKGSPQVQIGGRVILVPLSTITVVDRKFTTSMTRQEILASR